MQFVSPSWLFLLFVSGMATPEIYPLSHTTLFRSADEGGSFKRRLVSPLRNAAGATLTAGTACRSMRMAVARSEEHTSELQSLRHLVCRLLLEKKKSHDKS